MATIVADQMKNKLVSLDKVRERFASTEPLSQVAFDTSAASKVKFKLGPAWNAGLANIAGTEAVDAHVKIGGVEYKLTKDAILEATSLIGLPKNFVQKVPGTIVAPILEWGYKNGNVERKLLAVGDVGHAFTKASISPFSNLRLMDEVLAAIEKKYGKGTVVADFKFTHSLRKTYLRLVVPEKVRQMRPDDPWSVGVQLTNSLVGEVPLSQKGYLFRWVCTNGQTTIHASSGNYNRRTQGQGEQVYEWARASVDEILGGLEDELDKVHSLTAQPLEGEVADVLSNVFSTYRVPLAARTTIMENMADSADLTAYGVQNAITAAANSTTSGLSDDSRDDLMAIGGAMPHALVSRCTECHRINLN